MKKDLCGRRGGRCARRVATISTLVAVLAGGLTKDIVADVMADEPPPPPPKKKPRVGIIGGGIGGSFAAMYLSRHDLSHCALDSITLFDPSPLLSDTASKGRGHAGGPPSSGDFPACGDYQGPRVSSLTLADGRVVELGASILYSGNRLVTEVVEADPRLFKVDPLSPGDHSTADDEAMPDGFGVYEGEGKWDLNTAGDSDSKVTAKLLYRYNTDLFKMRRVTLDAAQKFDAMYDLLDDTDESSFLPTPDDLWEAVKLEEPITMDFDKYLTTHVGLSSKAHVKNWIIPGMGSLRDELVTCANLCNYNQNNTQLNGLAGLVSFIPTIGETYSVQGGNSQILYSAFHRYQEQYTCGNVQHVQKKISKVKFVNDSVEIWDSDGVLLGNFDIVLLAAPLQQCQIEFVMENGEQPLPFLQRVTDAPLPSSTTRRYTQTITTIVRNATLQESHFGSKRIPRSVYPTVHGREVEGFSSISQLTADGTFKMFTSEIMDEASRNAIFGPNHVVHHVKVWGGDHGGAYPNFNAGGESSQSAPFLLHQAAQDGPALYYVNAMEAAVSAMEILAIGAKHVSKLVAKRVGMLGQENVDAESS